MNIWTKVGMLDRRWIFMAVGVAVFTPMMFNVQCRQVSTPIVEGIFEKIESLE